MSHKQAAAGGWNLYRVRSAVVKRWRLQRYPFDDQMLLDPHLLIVYPFAGFFYVNPENMELADAIQTGFERVIADGSSQRLV